MVWPIEAGQSNEAACPLPCLLPACLPAWRARARARAMARFSPYRRIGYFFATLN
jgi:hypothetical protein